MKHFKSLYEIFRLVERIAIYENNQIDYNFLKDLNIAWNTMFLNETGINKKFVDFIFMDNMDKEKWIKPFLSGLFNIEFLNKGVELFIEDFFDTLGFEDLFVFIETNRFVVNKCFIKDQMLNKIYDVKNGILYSTNTFNEKFMKENIHWDYL